MSFMCLKTIAQSAVDNENREGRQGYLNEEWKPFTLTSPHYFARLMGSRPSHPTEARYISVYLASSESFISMSSIMPGRPRVVSM